MIKSKDLESRVMKLEKGPDKQVLAAMNSKARAIAGNLLNQIQVQVLKVQ